MNGLSRSAAWAKAHMGAAVEFGGVLYTLEDIRGSTAVLVADGFIKTAHIDAVRRAWMRENVPEETTIQ